MIDVGTRMIIDGYISHFNRREVAGRCDCSEALINQYFTDADELRSVVLHAAIETNNLRVIGQGIAAKVDICLELPTALKERAVLSLVG